MANEIEVIKKANTITPFTQQQLVEYAKCIRDPLYFIKNYTYVQHPIRGKLLFEPYPYQEEMIIAFNKYKKVVACTGRQQGKSVSFETNIMVNGFHNKIGELFNCFSFKEKIVNYLEKLLMYFSKKL